MRKLPTRNRNSYINSPVSRYCGRCGTVLDEKEGLRMEMESRGLSKGFPDLTAEDAGVLKEMRKFRDVLELLEKHPELFKKMRAMWKGHDHISLDITLSRNSSHFSGYCPCIFKMAKALLEIRKAKEACSDTVKTKLEYRYRLRILMLPSSGNPALRTQNEVAR